MQILPSRYSKSDIQHTVTPDVRKNISNLAKYYGKVDELNRM